MFMMEEKTKASAQPAFVDTMTEGFEAETQTKKVKCKNCGNEFVVTTKGRRFVFAEDAKCQECGRTIGS